MAKEKAETVFVSVENARRSQMAQAFAERFGLSDGQTRGIDGHDEHMEAFGSQLY